MRVLITRPRAEAAVLAADLAERGHDVTIEPLLTIEPLPGVVAALAGAQAIVLTSANAVPALPATGVRLPVFAVGAATARAARAHGCEEVHAAAGDAQSLAGLIAAHCRPAAGPLLHLAGAEVRPGLAEALAAAGLTLRRQTVYRATAARGLSGPVVEALRRQAIDAVLLFSPRTATTLVELIAAHQLAGCLGRTEAICLSAAVAARCRRLEWRAVRVAPRPEVGSLLAQLEGVGRRC
ncbi:MAG: hemD [Geminicoccaceae bacterium]|jgi:uroporphyrinogen-III synthase|nr:hemD [Geminicoccaceae bacterium]